MPQVDFIQDGRQTTVSAANPLPVFTGFKIPPFSGMTLGYTGTDLTTVTYRMGQTTVFQLALTWSNGLLQTVDEV